MKGKINKDGGLEIWRKSHYQAAACINKQVLCNDFCSHFGEPDEYTTKGTSATLQLCERTLDFILFQDERE